MQVQLPFEVTQLSDLLFVRKCTGGGLFHCQVSSSGQTRFFFLEEWHQYLNNTSLLSLKAHFHMQICFSTGDWFIDQGYNQLAQTLKSNDQIRLSCFNLKWKHLHLIYTTDKQKAN